MTKQIKPRAMNPYLAVGIAEGFEEGTEQEKHDAWQYLVDTGMCWRLQGWFGRTAMALIEQGLIESPKEKVKDFYDNEIKFPEVSE